MIRMHDLWHKKRLMVIKIQKIWPFNKKRKKLNFACMKKHSEKIMVPREIMNI